MIINFVSTNPFKIKRAKENFEPEIKVEGVGLELIEPQSNDQEYVARYKADQAYDLIKKPVIVEDVGIYIKKYNDFPGILTKYILSGIGIDGIEKLIEEGEPAFYKSTFAYKDSEREFIVSCVMEGTLTKKKRSANFNAKMPFKSIFIPEGFNVPVSDLPEGKLNAIPFYRDFYSNFKDTLLLNTKGV